MGLWPEQHLENLSDDALQQQPLSPKAAEIVVQCEQAEGIGEASIVHLRVLRGGQWRCEHCAILRVLRECTGDH